MFGKIFSSIGGSLGGMIGSALGGGIFSSIGRYAGKWLGDHLDKPNTRKNIPAKIYEVKHSYIVKNIKTNFSLNKASYGEAIPLLFGASRVNGKIIWAKQIKEIRNQSSEAKYFGDDKLKSISHVINCEYYFSFALSLCEGEITEVGRIWANDRLIDLGDYKFHLYMGSEEQNPNQLILEDNQNQAPAFKGLAYIVFEDLPLADFGNSIPVFSFEITRKPNVDRSASVEDLVSSMVMIPGSGEYVYDTIIQYKIQKDSLGAEISRSVINSHNHSKLANSIHSLNQLQLICSNVKWVAPVVCWFGDNLNAANCRIRPGVEFNESNIDYTENWRVGHYNRSNAMVISRDELGNPVYGGSINDASLLRYLTELRSRDLKIMFYPMFLMDVAGKPWRGHLTGEPRAVSEFFTKNQGYNEFILHYANLVKNHVDAFVIGSELIGLTKVRQGQNFPAVDELVKLVKQVKDIVGGAKVLYAADWSEYHHTEGGWYNLDPLWASPYLDYVGIDAYFPITHTSSSQILSDEIMRGFQSGEGYDYYYDHNNNEQPLQPAYAWKNVRYWWENIHINPDGNQTAWRPKMKKIWFTEFGFPSIDKSTNQPNVFFDPKCSDGGVPKFSTGETDFSLQRKAIKSFIQFWQTQEYIEQLFLWTWDARPYPAWPHMNIWEDGNLWEKGHWVNNKFGAASLSSILLELSKRARINTENVDAQTLDEAMEGVIFKNQQTIIEAINTLRVACFFDLTSINTNQIKFIKRGQSKSYDIHSKLLVKLDDNNFFETEEIAKEQILSKLEIYFIDHTNFFNYEYCQVSNENLSNKNTIPVKLPFCMSQTQAEILGNLILKNAAIEDQIVRFRLPLHAFEYEPADIVNLCYRGRNYQIRIISIEIQGLILEIIGIFDDAKSYNQLPANYDLRMDYILPIETKLVIVELPFNLNNNYTSPHLIAYLQSEVDAPLYGSVAANNSQPTKITDLKSGACIGKITSFTHSSHANIFLIDEISNFTLSSPNFARSVKSGWNLILIGEEIISFKEWQDLGNNCYQISRLIRGKFGTEEHINSHRNHQEFILISVCPNIIPISKQLIGREIYFKTAKSDEITVDFSARSNNSMPPYITDCLVQENSLMISWQTRSLSVDDWLFPLVTPKYQFIIDILSDKGVKQFKTDNKNLIINLAETDISGQTTISIVAKDELGNIGRPSTKNLSI